MVDIHSRPTGLSLKTIQVQYLKVYAQNVKAKKCNKQSVTQRYEHC